MPLANGFLILLTTPGVALEQARGAGVQGRAKVSRNHYLEAHFEKNTIPLSGSLGSLGARERREGVIKSIKKPLPRGTFVRNRGSSEQARRHFGFFPARPRACSRATRGVIKSIKKPLARGTFVRIRADRPEGTSGFFWRALGPARGDAWA